MMALGFAIARSTNIDSHLHVQGMLAELIQHTEFLRSCLRAARPTPQLGPTLCHAGGDAVMDGADDVP